MLTNYRSFDLYPEKIGVNAVIIGYLNIFQPWYYSGRCVYHGAFYELRSDAEKAAEELRNHFNT